MQRLLIRTLAAVLCCVALSSAQQPECKDSSDCGANRCCTILSGQHQPLPTCNEARALGEACRPGQTPSNQTFLDNNGKPSYWEMVYSDLCPCAEGLSCDRASGGTCQ